MVVDPDEFTAAIHQVRWLDVYMCTDVDKAVRLLSSKITSILDKMAPMKTVQVRTNYNPWISQETKTVMLERDELQKRAAEAGDLDLWRRYKHLRNQVTNRLKSEEKNWQKFKLAECGNDSAKTWRSIRGILNWQSSGSPSQIF